MNAEAATNPLLDFGGLPRFDAIRAEHVTPAIERLIADVRDRVAAVAADPRDASWDTIVEPLADALDRLERAWGAVQQLNAVVSTPELRDSFHASLTSITDCYTELAQDRRLFGRYRALAGSPSFATLDAAKQRVVNNALRDFRLGGAELPSTAKERFREVEHELAELTARFEDNVLDATNDWSLYVGDERELSGVPPHVVAAARSAAQADGNSGWKLTLRMPCYAPVMAHADDRGLRGALHRAYATRASDLGVDPRHDNTPLIARIVALRQELARLLGYANFAELSLVPKMAQSADEVLSFLRDLARRARPIAEREYAELVAFARDELAIADLAPWDVAYASEKLKAKRFAFSDDDVRQYFPEDRVLGGLFRVAEMLYGISIREGRAATWHPSVRFYDIRDGAGTLIGQFYLDNHARPGKRGGAWMDDAINRRRAGARIQHPVAYLNCNLSPPVDGRRATFTHDEVRTLFHEFGHGLHQLLTRIEVAGVSGIQGVEWDAVELPSQFMEHFCWESDVLVEMSEHVETGERLPHALLEGMLAAKNFQTGLSTLRHLELALFDMLLHAQRDPAREGSAQAVLDAVRREVAVVPRARYDRFLHSFAHVFAGEYAAGYYSYLWAEVLSADAFSAFEESGVLSSATGRRFRDEVLARGGSRDALDSFVAFRGRAPQLDALLRHNGLLAET